MTAMTDPHVLLLPQPVDAPVHDGGRPEGAPEHRLHPRPQLRRPSLAWLSGPWAFAYDDGDDGVRSGWRSGRFAAERTITVPFPPESTRSGIGDPGFHPVVWYRRTITQEDLRIAGIDAQGDRVLLHFGAVDYRADVWLAGRFLGSHEGGHTPFTFDVTTVVREAGHALDLVVRAEDDPHDVGQPRGKQDWQLEPHGIWYQRTTGIWQPVWLEAVPALHVEHLAWSVDLDRATVSAEVELSDRPTAPVDLRFHLQFEGRTLAELQVTVTEPRSTVVIPIARQVNGQEYEHLLWSPEAPRLVQADIVLNRGPHEDRVSSYLGLRDVGWASGHFMLNDRPYFVRAVLAQGYWTDSHLAAPDEAAITAEVRLIKDLGFNTVRVHQKFEDPRFLAEADRLGLLVWAETPSAFEFSVTAVERLTREWLDVVRRDRSHPCIVTWVPLNESWGVQHIAHDPAQLHYAQALYHLTKAVDPTRPVVTNDGWEHADSDILTIHDYAVTGAEVAANYVDRPVVDAMLGGVGPLGRRMRLVESTSTGQPVMVSEFGGISYAPGHEGEGWGYATVDRPAEYEALLRELFTAVQSSPVLAGFCYTQLSDTMQEVNGLTDADRRPKLPIATIRTIVLGEDVDRSTHRRPKRPEEKPLGTAG